MIQPDRRMGGDSRSENAKSLSWGAARISSFPANDAQGPSFARSSKKHARLRLPHFGTETRLSCRRRHCGPMPISSSLRGKDRLRYSIPSTVVCQRVCTSDSSPTPPFSVPRHSWGAPSNPELAYQWESCRRTGMAVSESAAWNFRLSPSPFSSRGTRFGLEDNLGSKGVHASNGTLVERSSRHPLPDRNRRPTRHGKSWAQGAS